MLEARNLERHYQIGRGLFKGSATLQALRGASFEMYAGRTLAVVGESGCGKSTLARLLTLIEEPTAGTLKIDDVDVTHVTGEAKRKLRQKVQIVFQDPYGSLNPRKKVGSILDEPLKVNTELGADERRARVRSMLAHVGLRPEHYGRYPHMFSGGQRQRIAVARALMLNPEIVILDEPVSALDVSIQAQVLNLLNDLQDEFRLAYLFISHDLSVVRHVADEVIVMYLGRPIEHGAAGGSVRDAAASLHARAPGEQPVDRSAPSLQAHRGQGRAALAAGAAARLRVPSPLPVRQRTLPWRGAEAAVLSRHHPPARLSRGRGAPPARPAVIEPVAAVRPP